jgi:hypothetical protein
MDYHRTQPQVPRGSLPDAGDDSTWLLLKNVSTLRLTYQIRLLTFGAGETRRRLVIKVPRPCELSPDLKTFVRANKRVVKIEEVR